MEASGPVFEFKLNITDSDFIIIADPSLSDSTAIILRSTTVLAYRPDMVDRPFSANLNNAEVFSCQLGGNEEESALSIIDPVTINFEIAGRNVPGMPSKGLSDLIEEEDGYHRLGSYERTAEIQLQQLHVRLSYHDWLVFQKIVDSFPKQATDAFEKRNPVNVDHQLNQLTSLGFQPEECRQALAACQGHLDEAALWLTQNCQLSPAAAAATAGSVTEGEAPVGGYFLEGSKVSFTNFECKISTINICIIDDCRDADVPLVDLTLQRLHMHHDYERIGEASCVLASSYYNRALSSWEPMMEPWKCSLGWKIGGQNNKRLVVSIDAEDTINFNCTTTLMELYRRVKADWTNTDNITTDESLSAALIRGCTRRRMPFTPFAIKNETGLSVWFRRLSKGKAGPSSSSGAVDQWVQVEDGQEMEFSFEEGSRSLSAHQIILLVEGWQEVSPVTIDRVGTFFRKAIPATSFLDMQTDQVLPPIRVVFDVSIKGAALKLVTVRSALLVENKLLHPMELRLDNNTLRPNDVYHMILPSEQVVPVPLPYAWSKMTGKILLNFLMGTYWETQVPDSPGHSS